MLPVEPHSYKANGEANGHANGEFSSKVNGATNGATDGETNGDIVLGVPEGSSYTEAPHYAHVGVQWVVSGFTRVYTPPPGSDGPNSKPKSRYVEHQAFNWALLWLLLCLCSRACASRASKTSANYCCGY